MEYDHRNLYFEWFYSSPIGIVILDYDLRLHKVNTAFSKMVGKSKDELLEDRFTDYISPETLKDFINEMMNLYNKPTSDESNLFLKAKNSNTYFNVICNRMDVENSRFIGCNVIDVTDEKKEFDELRYMGFHDQLTNLYNRRFFVEEIKRLDVKRNLPLTIVMADVNGLKLINDSFGHSAGDELLVKVANAIKAACRKDDIVARLGGDEFVILLPKTHGIVAREIIERIRLNLTHEEIKFMEISVSFGLCTKINESEDITDVYKKSEDRMYRRKMFEGPSMRSRTIDSIIKTFYNINKTEEYHSKRVGYLCKKLAKALNFSELQIREMETIGLIHDIGKIGIDHNILIKPKDELTENEWTEIRRHPEIGYQILSSVADMAGMANVILHHHERWDGKGYPKGLKGLDIPKKSRLLSICDVYDFLTRNKPYGPALSREEAVEELIKNSGTQFDPEMLKVFVEKVLNICE